MFPKEDVVIPDGGRFLRTSHISLRDWGWCWKSWEDPQLEFAVVSKGSACISGVGAIYKHFPSKLAELTSVLTPLTTKACDALFPTWTSWHEATFLGIWQLVTSADCLTTINHKDLGDNKIWVTCNVSQWRTGACFSFGETWEMAWPVAFESQQMNAQQTEIPNAQTGITVDNPSTCQVAHWSSGYSHQHLHRPPNLRKLQSPMWFV